MYSEGILYEDSKVPLLKSDGTWALTLENALNSENGPVHPRTEEGYQYESYLRMLLTAVTEETILLRAMDLIQINMKYLYNGTFRLKDYYTGLQFTLKINGQVHEYDESFERPQRELSG